MSTPIIDGGPAFPQSPINYPNGEQVYGSIGMTLRDYFAGKALVGMLASGIVDGVVGPEWTEDDYAEQSFLFADAMIAAR